MPAPAFDALWRSHPALQNPPVIEPCSKNGKSNHANQCVIRMGICLTNAGVAISSFKGAFCWNGHGKNHPLRVEEFKLWLNSKDAPFGKAEISKRSVEGVQKSHHHYIGKEGIVVFRNFWGSGNAGDHVDLWNGNRVAHCGTDYFERSQGIWFWEL